MSPITFGGNSGWVLMPVPTAVPPSGSSASVAIASSQRRRARSTWPA